MVEDKYTLALVESADKYFTDLASYGKNSNVTLKDLFLYTIVHDMYLNAGWYEWGELTRRFLQKKMINILNNNPELVILKSSPGVHPVNVNTLQGLYTWRTISIVSTDLKTT